MTYQTANTVKENKSEAIRTSLDNSAKILSTLQESIPDMSEMFGDWIERIEDVLGRNAHRQVLIKKLEDVTFLLETLAHLRGLEGEILPTTGASREAIRQAKGFSTAEFVQVATRILLDSGLTRQEWVAYWRKESEGKTQYSGMDFHQFVCEVTYEEEFCIQHDC